MNMSIRIYCFIAFFAALLCVPPAEAPAAEAPPPGDGVVLLIEKCTKCHTLGRVFKESSPVRRGEHAWIINDMQEKQPDWESEEEKEKFEGAGRKWISDGQKQRLISMFDNYEIDRIEKLVEDKTESAVGEADAERLVRAEKTELAEKAVKIYHGLHLLAAFILMGVFLALSGASRFVSKRNIADNFIIGFDWKLHIARGKVFVLTVLIGFGLGFFLFAMEGFHIGDEALHLYSGITIASLYTFGGLLGIMLAGGKAKSLGWLHAACTIIATALFLFNIASGLLFFLE